MKADITFFKMINKRLVQFQEKYLRNPVVIGYPFHLVLETGNVCNLKCPLCPTPQRERTIPRGMLTLENAVRIIDQIPFLLHTNLSLWGEPLLNKEIYDIIAYARSKNIEVLLQSNLNILDEQMTVKLVDSGLNILQISLDGASQEGYQKYRVGGDFPKVIKNIEKVIEAREKMKRKDPHIIWKMVVNRFNEHEMEKAKNWANHLGVEFTVVEIYTPPQLAKEWKPIDKIDKSYHIHSDMVDQCYSLWQVAVINFNGDVFPCCSEFSPKDALGNVFEEPFSRIWNNDKYRRLRSANKCQMNCQICHTDKETRWYKKWMMDKSPT